MTAPAYKDKVIIITGASGGIGSELARQLAKQGALLVLASRDLDRLQTVRAECEALGGQAFVVQTDVILKDQCAAMVQSAFEHYGRIDVLINGAGPYHRINLFEETVDGWREMFDGNLHPIFYLAQAVAPGMKTRKSGRIINFSMANADQMIAQPDVTAHYIAKAGILILTRTLAKLLAPHGITVNAVSPGFIDSGSAPPEELAGMTKRIPAGYIGTVDDTVAAVRYLLSNEARYVNGANIQISGAWGI